MVAEGWTPPPGIQARRGFATTRWSLVARAGGADEERARDALAALCEAYWYPVYAYVRRRGRSGEDALDATQGFFTELLERRDLARADARRGRFRSFLLTCAQHYLANQHDRSTAQKRGGGRAPVSLDARDAEERYRFEPAAGDDPERAFERAWARTLLERVVGDLGERYAREGRAELFEALRPTLGAGAEGAGYREVAERLGVREGALRVAAHRLRRRFAEDLRAAIRDTVAGEDEVDEELRGLFRALAAGNPPGSR